MNQNQETKLITIETRQPQSINNVIINGVPARDVIRNLINNNLKLRYMLYMFGLSGIIMLSFYLGLKDNYEDLLMNYHNCRNNYTEMLDEYQNMNTILHDKKIVGIIYDQNHYKLCTIPKLYYNTCFENI